MRDDECLCDYGLIMFITLFQAQRKLSVNLEPSSYICRRIYFHTLMLIQLQVSCDTNRLLFLIVLLLLLGVYVYDYMYRRTMLGRKMEEAESAIYAHTL